MRYRLRTLMIAMAIGPPLLAVVWFSGGIARGLVLWAIAIASYAGWTALIEQYCDKPAIAD